MNDAPQWIEDLLIGPGRRLLWRIRPMRGLHRQLVAQIRVTCELRRRLTGLGEDVEVN